MAWLNHFWKLSCGFFDDLFVFPLAGPPNPVTCLLSACFSLVVSQCPSVPLQPIPAADPLTIEFALDVRCDPQLSAVPEVIHSSAEVFRELG